MQLTRFTADLAPTVSSWATSPVEVAMWCGHSGAPVPVETIHAWVAEQEAEWNAPQPVSYVWLRHDPSRAVIQP